MSGEIRWRWRSDEGAAARCRDHSFPVCGDGGSTSGRRLHGDASTSGGRAWVFGFHMPCCQLLPAPAVGSPQPQAESQGPSQGLPIQPYLSGGPPHTEKGCWRILFSQRYVFLKTSNSANNDMVTKSTACGSPGQTQNCDHAGDCEGVGGGRGRDTSRLQ